MSLTILPDHYLEFSSPDSECTAKLLLTNPHDTMVLFKVKTTAPKSYTVKPANGEIQANEQVTVLIDFHPPSSAKDKFLVLSTRAKQWDDTSTHEHKLRVKFADGVPVPVPVQAPVLTKQEVQKEEMIKELPQGTTGIRQVTNVVNRTNKSEEDKGILYLCSIRVANTDRRL